MPQVASDPKIHTFGHTFARPARPTQQPDGAPSPFESLLDDGAQPSEQPASAPPENKTAPADTSQAPSKTKDSKPVANDNATVKQSNDSDPLDKPDGDDKSAVDSKAVVDVKLVDTVADGDGTKVADDGKPKDAPKTDSPTITPPTDTIIGTDKITAAPVPTVTPLTPDQGEQGKELPQQVPLVTDAVPLLKPVDSGLLKAPAAKQTNAGNPADADKQIDDDQPTGETADSAQPSPKIVTQAHADKPQFVTSDSDNQHIAQARGEGAANGNHTAFDATVSVSADAGATTSNVSNNTVQTVAPAHSTPTAATPATPATPPTPQVAPIPLAGVPLEIASKVLAGKNRFEIRLDPPELGRIEVRLDVDRAGNVTSRLTVDRAETLDLLRRDASGLERALQDAGLKTGDNGLQFALRDQSMSQQQTSRGSDTTQLVVTDETLPSIDANLQNYNRIAGQGGGLDIRV